MHELIPFLKSRNVVTIATRDGEELWIANVYYGVDDNCKLYFISSEHTKHSQHILKNSNIAFAISWYDPENHKDRKGVQGLGTCRPATTEEEIITGVKLHNANYPEFVQRITIDWIHNNEYQSRVWIIEPSYVKHFNDEQYGDGESKEFNF